MHVRVDMAPTRPPTVSPAVPPDPPRPTTAHRPWLQANLIREIMSTAMKLDDSQRKARIVALFANKVAGNQRALLDSP